MKKLVLVFTFLLSAHTGFSQQWQRTDGKALTVSERLERMSQPASYVLFTLNPADLQAKLQVAPVRDAGVASAAIVSFPDGNGKLKSFRMYKVTTMHPQLAAQYDGIQSYVGQSIENPAESVRVTTSLFGLHAMMFTSEGTSYIDPYSKDLQTCIAYKREGLTTERSFYCGVTDDLSHSGLRTTMAPMGIETTDGKMRTYRLAMACTIEYAAFHINAAGLNAGTLAQKKAAVLAAMVVTVDRVNSVYERDLGIALQLVHDNDALIFINSDNLDNSNTDNALLNQSQETIDPIIGFDNYDIGHIVSTGGGGVAQLWSPCSNSKARGITGLPSPVGDPYDIDFVAHEMGHQFGGNHSFNNECGGNRSDDNAYEPGSGTTIMAYAGVCAPNVQNNSDAHFHANSIAEMSYFIANFGTCSQNVVTGNVPPVVNAGVDYTIPKGTAFVLTGSATDANGDALTYNWEQMDKEISIQPPVPSSNEGPNFRSLPSKDVPERWMPNINSVVNNNLTPTWEVVANVGREYNFAFTVRDNNILGGQVVTDFMKVTVSGTAGPFLVSVPNTNVSWQAGTNKNVTWDVAGTTANGVNTPYVDILLSTDGGFTYPIVLGAKVPNDGSEVVTVPNVTGSQNRIMVKGYNNIFYDISNTNFAITAPASTMAIAAVGEQNKTNCVGNTTQYTLAYNAYAGFNGATAFTVTGNPAGSTVTFNPETIAATGNIVMTVETTDGVAPGFYTLAVTATSGTETKNFNLYLDLVDANFGNVLLASPENGAEAVFAEVGFSWSAAANALAYQIEIATDAAFTNIVETATTDAISYQASLASETGYFWRVRPVNTGCAGDYSTVFEFATGNTECSENVSSNVPVAISGFDTVTVTSQLTVAANAPIVKVSVNLNISHTWIGDLSAVITSPSGTSVNLFTNVCDDKDGVNATFDDNGIALICADNPALSGLLLPEQPLSAFNDESPQGLWTLTVSDNFDQDGGTINSWSLDICTNEPPTNGVNDNAFNSFVLYPNPNNGDFTVKFNSESGKDILLTVYDMRGRLIVTKPLANTGSIEHTVSLGAAEAGIYLVQVKDGEQSITKKIIVQ